MGQYSIKELEHLTGVKAHTLRIWEQRYKFVKPKRTRTNIRYYTDDDMKKILNISILNKYGLRIGTIAKMDKNAIKENINNISESNESFKYELHINKLATCMLELDEQGFEKIITTCILQVGLEKTMFSIIYPFLQKIGVMWLTNRANPAQEHFIVNLIRQKLIVAIDGQVVKPDNNSKKYLLFLPEDELHEVSLLFLCYLLKVRNHIVTYLGANVPFSNIIPIANKSKSEYLYTIFTAPIDKNEMLNYLKNLSQKVPNKQIVASGSQVCKLNIDKLPKNVSVLKSINEIMQFVENSH
ncbi:MAG: MerR family transcriptional regulator [Chitinophagales bacterium]